MDSDVFDILIIGGGPTGLFAAFYAGLRGMKTKILDSLSELGGQLTTLYPEKYIYDVPGFTKILAKEYAARLIEQAMVYHPVVCTNEKVLQLQRITRETGDIFHLTTEPGGSHYGKALLITAGIGAFTPKKIDDPEIAQFEGRGVAYFIKEKKALRGKRVLIVGGGDSAIDWAFTLLDVASGVTLIHRRNQFRAQEENVKRLQESIVTIKTPFELHGISGKGKVERATLFNNLTGEVEEMPVDFILFSLGFHSSIGPLKQWGLDLEKNDIKVSSWMESSQPGIYAAGDASWYPGKLKLIVTGLGEAAIAVNAIKTVIDPKAKFYPGHSTDLKTPPIK